MTSTTQLKGSRDDNETQKSGRRKRKKPEGRLGGFKAGFFLFYLILNSLCIFLLWPVKAKGTTGKMDRYRVTSQPCDQPLAESCGCTAGCLYEVCSTL